MSKYDVAMYHKNKACKNENVLAKLYSVRELLGRCLRTDEVHDEIVHVDKLIWKIKAINDAHWAIYRQLLDRCCLRRSEQLSKQTRSK